MRNPIYWRNRRILLGNPEAWRQVIKRESENNPHLSLAVLASENLTEQEVFNIHERLKAHEVPEM